MGLEVDHDQPTTSFAPHATCVSALVALTPRAGSGMFWITVRGDQVVQIGEQWSP